ncbi:MAG: PQQ-binding-like beta-propeller repeat protein [Pseudomonadales bacterium]|nr:PQQ-binding-like beta-propeller repeat protein [Pseudomonadales bacterium]
MKTQNKKVIRYLFAVTALLGITGCGDDVPNWGFGLENTNYQKSESQINPNNVGSLEVEHIIEVDGNVHAYPTIHSDSVYFVSNGLPAFVEGGGGSVYSYDIETGEKNWSKKINSFLPQPPDLAADPNQNWSRTSPAISRNTLIIGTQMDSASLFAGFPLGFPKGAWIIAVNRKNGDLIWRVKASNHPASIITQSPTIHNGIVYVGISSQEEGFAIDANYPCCSFRGSMLALDIKTGEVMWETDTIPPAPVDVTAEEWFSGNAIWGSAPAIDLKRKSIYIATGNNYEVPEALSTCISIANATKESCITDAGTDPDALDTCVAIHTTDSSLCLDDHDIADNYTDSIMALDLHTGAVKWSRNLQGFDAWNVACLTVPGIPIDPANCPDPTGPDFDFAQGVMIMSTKDPETGVTRELVGAGQKSGFFWALDPDDGDLVWGTASVQSPTFPFETGGTAGGLQWGSAFDPVLNHIYVQDVNFDSKPFALKAGSDNFYPVGHALYPKKVEAGDMLNVGSTSALDATTGEVLWTVPNFFGVFSMGPVSAANGVVYAGSMLDRAMHAYDAKTGKILFSYTADGHVNSAPTISNGRLFWGSGYQFIDQSGYDNKLIIFKLPD